MNTHQQFNLEAYNVKYGRQTFAAKARSYAHLGVIAKINATKPCVEVNKKAL